MQDCNHVNGLRAWLHDRTGWFRRGLWGFQCLYGLHRDHPGVNRDEHAVGELR